VKRSVAIQSMLSSRPAIDEAIDNLQSTYAAVFTDHDVDVAKEELSQSLSSLLVWDKGTIWHDLIKLERNKTRCDDAYL
jgi:hypothetical protein